MSSPTLHSVQNPAAAHSASPSTVKSSDSKLDLDGLGSLRPVTSFHEVSEVVGGVEGVGSLEAF